MEGDAPLRLDLGARNMSPLIRNTDPSPTHRASS